MKVLDRVPTDTAKFGMSFVPDCAATGRDRMNTTDEAQVIMATLSLTYDAGRVHDVSAAIKAALDLRIKAALDLSPVDALWHPLGFFRIEVGQDAAGRRYVLHCWPPEERHTQRPAWTVHCHKWPLESMVLAGTLVDSEFVRSATTQRTDGAIYSAHGQPGASVLSKTQRSVSLHQTGRESWSAGDSYQVPLTAFHVTDVPLQSHCLTVARIGESRRARAEVVGENDGPQRLYYVHEKVATDVLRRGLSLL